MFALNRGWIVVLASATLAIAGCGSSHPGQTCKADADCNPTDACVNGLCVVRAGTTTGASATGSSSGSSSGSSTSATSTSGGSSSGATSSGSTGSTTTTTSSGTTGTTTSGSSTGSSGTTGSPVCNIGGQPYAAGDVNPANACEVCQAANPSSWTVLADGSTCGAGKVCNADACLDGCFVGGVFYGPDGGSTNDACQFCDPSTSTTQLSSRSDGFSCGAGQLCQNGQCGTSCDIDGGIVPTGSIDPADSCASCQPGTSTTSYSVLADGSDCASTMVCASGVCSTACYISGQLYELDAGSPTNVCQDCAPDQNTHGWSNRPDGWSCATDEICRGGACTYGCWVNGTFYATDAGSTDSCQGCFPGTSTQSFSARQDGIDCDAGSVCNTGACQQGCYIGTSFEAPDAGQSGNPCASCQPSASTHTWTATADNANPYCAAGSVCHTGNCTAGCYISGGYYVPDAGESGNDCQVCVPATSTTSWTAGHEGATDTCGAGQVCHTGACATGCFISGRFVDAGIINVANSCESCQPTVSTSAYKPMSDGTACTSDGGHYCRADQCLYACNVAGYGVVDAGATKGSNTCQTCQPNVNATDFTNVANGTACPGTGDICYSGTCQNGCYINGQFQNANDTNGSNSCQTCAPSTSTSAWTNKPEGTTCAVNGGDYCHNGGSGSTCQYGCFINNTFVPNGTYNSANGCQVCNAAVSKTSWTQIGEGATPNNCGAGQVCHNNVCTTGCYISGAYVASGTTTNYGCAACQPLTSTTSYTTVSAKVGTVCNMVAKTQYACTSGGSCGACADACTCVSGVDSCTGTYYCCSTDCSCKP